MLTILVGLAEEITADQYILSSQDLWSCDLVLQVIV